MQLVSRMAPELDPAGAACHLGMLGQALDAVRFPAIMDLDRVAMLTITATYKLATRADAQATSKGHSNHSSSMVSEHPEPHETS